MLIAISVTIEMIARRIRYRPTRVSLQTTAALP